MPVPAVAGAGLALGWCWAVGRGQAAPPGAQPWLFLSCFRDLWQERRGLSRAWQLRSVPPPQPGREQGRPGTAQSPPASDVAGLEAKWEAILQARVSPGSHLGSQGWAQPHGCGAGPRRWDKSEVKVGCQSIPEDPQAPWTGRGSSAAEDPRLSRNGAQVHGQQWLGRPRAAGQGH